MTTTPPTQYEAQMLHFAPQVIAELKAEIRRKDALLRQALEALRASTPDACPMDDDYAEQGWSRHSKAISAITKELQ